MFTCPNKGDTLDFLLFFLLSVAFFFSFFLFGGGGGFWFAQLAPHACSCETLFFTLSVKVMKKKKANEC